MNFKYGSNPRYYRRIAFEKYGKKCSICGITKDLRVHHKDEDRNNNKIENLQVVCHRCHLYKIHKLDFKGEKSPLYIDGRKKTKEYQREHNKKSYYKHREQRLKKHKEHYKINKEKILKKQRENYWGRKKEHGTIYANEEMD